MKILGCNLDKSYKSYKGYKSVTKTIKVAPLMKKSRSASAPRFRSLEYSPSGGVDFRVNATWLK